MKIGFVRLDWNLKFTLYPVLRQLITNRDFTQSVVFLMYEWIFFIKLTHLQNYISIFQSQKWKRRTHTYYWLLFHYFMTTVPEATWNINIHIFFLFYFVDKPSMHPVHQPCFYLIVLFPLWLIVLHSLCLSCMCRCSSVIIAV